MVKSSFAIEVFLFEGGLFLMQNKYKGEEEKCLFVTLRWVSVILSLQFDDRNSTLTLNEEFRKCAASSATIAPSNSTGPQVAKLSLKESTTIDGCTGAITSPEIFASNSSSATSSTKKTASNLLGAKDYLTDNDMDVSW